MSEARRLEAESYWDFLDGVIELRVSGRDLNFVENRHFAGRFAHGIAQGRSTNGLRRGDSGANFELWRGSRAGIRARMETFGGFTSRFT